MIAFGLRMISSSFKLRTFNIREETSITPKMNIKNVVHIGASVGLDDFEINIIDG